MGFENPARRYARPAMLFLGKLLLAVATGCVLLALL